MHVVGIPARAVTAGSLIGRGVFAACVTVFLVATASANRNDECLQTKEISEEVILDGIRDISVDAGAGSLTIIGRPGLSTARIGGVACERREGDMDKISFEAHGEGETLTIRTIMPTPVKVRLGNVNARLDLTVEIPSVFALRVVDTTGAMTVRGVASVEIRDDTGSIQVEDVPGLVHVVRDSSGSIDLLRVGSVRIDEDGSGSIRASIVEGDVHVGRDEAGSISAHDVGGSFTVVSNASGKVRHSNVAGDVRVNRKPRSDD